MEKSPHILVVQATVFEREKITALVDDSRARAEFVETPGEALPRLASSDEFDAVFMGIESPNQEYCQILEAVRHRRSPTTVVVISSVDDVTFYLTCLRHGVFDYIPRPVDWKEFRRIYALALHEPPAGQAARAQSA
jgi:DNA-binding NtrC family response regulator